MSDTDMTPGDLLDPVLIMMQSDSDAALARLDDLLTQYPADARLHFLRGSVLAALERYDAALPAMRAAVELAPGYDVARFQYGLLELSSGNAEAAQAIWSPLLDLPPEIPLRMFAEGLLIMLTGDYDRAVALLRAGIERNTELPPMNRDMTLLIDRMLAARETAARAPEANSGAHFLLKQYSVKNTRH